MSGNATINGPSAIIVRPYGYIRESPRQSQSGEGLGGAERVYDDWGNEVGLDGALTPGVKLWVK
jgi:hypothetical protein